MHNCNLFGYSGMNNAINTPWLTTPKNTQKGRNVPTWWRLEAGACIYRISKKCLLMSWSMQLTTPRASLLLDSKTRPSISACVLVYPTDRTDFTADTKLYKFQFSFLLIQQVSAVTWHEMSLPWTCRPWPILMRHRPISCLCPHLHFYVSTGHLAWNHFNS